MGTEIRTQLVHGTWFEKLKLWRHAYETKVFNSRHEAIGRGLLVRHPKRLPKGGGWQSRVPKKERGE